MRVLMSIVYERTRAGFSSASAPHQKSKIYIKRDEPRKYSQKYRNFWKNIGQ